MTKHPTVTKQDWIAALRSGKYQQAQFALHDGTGYCCLGVLCEIKGYKSKQYFSNGAYTYDLPFVGRVSGSIPTEWLAALGINTPDVLVSMNDGTDGYRRHTFIQIADYLESLP